MAEEKCSKVEPKEHLAAHLENRELVRNNVKEIACERDLLEKITYNYIIVKKILSFLSWQDQIISKCVCKTWRDAVKALQKELLAPQDYVLEVQEELDTAVLKMSGNITTEPLAALTFTNYTGFCKMGNCSSISPCPCSPPCNEIHWLLDCVDQELCYPKECNLIVRAGYLSYMPLPSSVTSMHTVNNDMLATAYPFICGVYIPKIPNVDFDILNLKANCDMKTSFYDVVDKISETRVFKGCLVFVTDKYLLNSLDDIAFLNYFKEVQPNDPYALGGCLIEDTVHERNDLFFFINHVNSEVNRADFISENVASIAMFTVPKQMGASSSHFEMYSFVIEFSEWSKPKIEKAVKEFSQSIPRFEHSLALKLSCVGRDERHEFEQDTFRAFFPNTALIGCYGNGELGLSHPARPAPKAPLNTVKRHKRDVAKAGIMYSYSTVFVYLGWGKMLSQESN